MTVLGLVDANVCDREAVEIQSADLQRLPGIS